MYITTFYQRQNTVFEAIHNNKLKSLKVAKSKADGGVGDVACDGVVMLCDFLTDR